MNVVKNEVCTHDSNTQSKDLYQGKGLAAEGPS